MPCRVPCGNAKQNDEVFEAVSKDPMEILYQRRCANFIYVAPEGLRELMSDISREVIRMHPPNLNHFIADYLHTLMVTRENAKVAMRLVEEIGDTSELLADLMVHTNLSRYKIDKSARIIQRTFRRLVKLRRYEDTSLIQQIALEKIMQRLKVTIEEAHKAATVIQHAYRLYKLRQERKYRAQEEPELYFPFRHIDWQIASQRTFDIFTHIRGVHMAEFHKAAILIQAAYRGYYTRKLLKDYWTLNKKEEEKINTDDDSEKQKKDWAARVLQRCFRKIVKEIKRKKLLNLFLSEQSPSCTVSTEQLKGMSQVLATSSKFVKIGANAETLSLHATTSVDMAIIQDRCARIIQRFFRRILAQKKTMPATEREIVNITYNTEVDCDIFVMDEEIENLFEEGKDL